MDKDVSKYFETESSNPIAPYAVALPKDTIEQLEKLRLDYNFKVRAWIRDLVVANLPRVKAEVGVD
jgi:hypothetical protein